jgi:hypothetical protein
MNRELSYHKNSQFDRAPSPLKLFSFCNQNIRSPENEVVGETATVCPKGKTVRKKNLKGDRLK